MSDFSPEQQERYARHLGMPEVGAAGQARLRAARVLVVGAGGLGSAVALYLAAGGVGTISLADDDRVELGNLQRQVLHRTDGVGRLKVESASEALRALNPDVQVLAHATRVEQSSVGALVADQDVVVDACDSFETRYLLNEATRVAGLPLVHGSVFRLDGQAATFLGPEHGPCYRCLFPVPPPPDLRVPVEQAGPLAPLPGLVGTIQALETIKVLLGLGETLAGRLLCIDGLGLEIRTFRVERNPQCPVCGGA
jgi:molybdopterin/thiamine biosynthesis adenylyltransferase